MHIDDHTLELFVLGAKSIQDKRSEIEAHLQACEHCRAYVDKVNGFYTQLDENIGKEILPNPKSALIRRHGDELAPLFYNDAPPVLYRPTTRIEKFRHFVRRHPIATGSGTFAVLAGLAMMLNVINRPVTRIDQNPAYYHYNTEKGLIEIRNSSNHTLWSLSSQYDLAAVRHDERTSMQTSTAITDMENDGMNEVLTVLTIGQESKKVYLRIYNANRTLRSSQSFHEEFKYSTESYSRNFEIGYFIVGEVAENGKKEIWLNTTNARSPSATIRLDSKGNAIGKYWHFGHLTSIYALDVDNDGKKEVIVTGINDLNEESYYQYPAIVAIDPDKVVGNGKSTTAPAFGFPFSSAELYYVRLPLSDLNTFYRFNAHVYGIADINENEIEFDVHSRPAGLPETIIFQYHFNRDMSIREVKSNNTIDRIHNQLVAQGKLTGKIDSVYLANLKNGVRYWDGKEWRKEVVRVDVRNSQLVIHH